MVELVSEAASPTSLIDTKASFDAGKSVCSSTAAANSQISRCPKCLVYVRYKDHVIFKNVAQQPVKPVERETVGWLTNQTDELLLIQNDRAVITKEKRVNGIIILRNCVIEAFQLPFPSSELASNNGLTSNKISEYAFRKAERKTHGAKYSGRGNNP